METKMKLINGDIVYSELSEGEIRQYLAGGSKGGCIEGYYKDSTTAAITDRVYIAVHSIEVIYKA